MLETTAPTKQSPVPPKRPDPAEQPMRAIAEDAQCPMCASTMHLWAGFYRCQNCGFKESCCF